MQLVLEGLGAGRPFAADDARTRPSTTPRPLLDGGGNLVDRALLPATPESISADEGARDPGRARPTSTTFTGLVGADSPTLEPLARHLLVAMATGLSDDATPGARRRRSSRRSTP